MKKAISTEQTGENIREVLYLLSRSPILLRKLSKGLTDEQLNASLGKDERSFTQGLVHLLNCEARTSEIIYTACLPKVHPLHQSTPERGLGKLLHYENFPFKELLQYFTFRRKVLLPVLESLTDRQWERSVHEKRKQRRESVYWQARGLALHESEHIQDLEQKIKEVK